jgi:WXG100 family type VII secretion target
MPVMDRRRLAFSVRGDLCMADEIRGVYAELQQIAQRFAAAQSEVQGNIQRVNNSMAPLDGGSWIGRGYDAFSREMHNEVMPAMNRLQQALAEAARVTSAISQTLEDADEQASSPFLSA